MMETNIEIRKTFLDTIFLKLCVTLLPQLHYQFSRFKKACTHVKIPISENPLLLVLGAKSVCNIEWCIFMDWVQLSQGLRTTTRRQFNFNRYAPKGTHLIDFGRTKG